MEFEQRCTMRDRYERYIFLLRGSVEHSFDIYAYCTCAIICITSISTKDCKQRSMVEQARHSDALLLTSRQYIIPIVDAIKASFSLYEVFQLYLP